MAFLEIKTNKATYYMECTSVYITDKEVEINDGEIIFTRERYFDKYSERIFYDEYEKVGVKDECLKYIKKIMEIICIKNRR